MVQIARRMREPRARWGWLAAILLLGGLAGLLAWRYRFSILHVVRLALQRWTLPDTPQDIPPQACPGAPWLLPTSGVLGVFWNDSPKWVRTPNLGSKIRLF